MAVEGNLGFYARRGIACMLFFKNHFVIYQEPTGIGIEDPSRLFSEKNILKVTWGLCTKMNCYNIIC
jgi:hypothetical protein